MAVARSTTKCSLPKHKYNDHRDAAGLENEQLFPLSKYFLSSFIIEEIWVQLLQYLANPDIALSTEFYVKLFDLSSNENFSSKSLPRFNGLRNF